MALYFGCSAGTCPQWLLTLKGPIVLTPDALPHLMNDASQPVNALPLSMPPAASHSGWLPAVEMS
eukprot:CAMPEP_0117668848 /NCGR_PEP_ID=MMETSP0804-20121206/11785_1 /TAXON_ID=1074897 /ORGANISM="Tetraselmis astigmatica, Strain CCMP880" /LENGTH=64 /DNA_ID=CAMNT_0005476801 /DNA_START=412 /DNA_END=606 /DNA_ORIENTATION=-